MKGAGKGKKSAAAPARKSVESKSSKADAASNAESKTDTEVGEKSEGVAAAAAPHAGAGAGVNLSKPGSTAKVAAESGESDSKLRASHTPNPKTSVAEEKARESHAVKASIAGEGQARESHAVKASVAVAGEEKARASHAVKGSVAGKHAPSASAGSVAVDEGGQRKSSAGEGGNVPRESTKPGADAEGLQTATPSEAPLALHLPLPTGSGGVKLKPHEDKNANKTEEKKAEAPEAPRRSTLGGEHESAPELGGGALQSDGGNLEKVLETYFGKQAATVQKQGQKSRRPRLIYENTYRLEPPKPFSVEPVQRCIELTLNEMLGPFLYNTNEAGELAGAIAEKIRSRVMSCRFERFKIIVLVTIGQMKRQGLHIGFRNIWDPVHDGYAFGEFKNSRIYGSAQVFGIYYE